MSSMCASSMNNTPGTMLALPFSFHSDTFSSICSRTSALISPVSPANSARKPCCRELITSMSCSDTYASLGGKCCTVCTTSLRCCSSPSGHCTYFVCG